MKLESFLKEKIEDLELEEVVKLVKRENLIFKLAKIQWDEGKKMK